MVLRVAWGDNDGVKFEGQLDPGKTRGKVLGKTGIATLTSDNQAAIDDGRLTFNSCSGQLVSDEQNQRSGGK